MSLEPPPRPISTLQFFRVLLWVHWRSFLAGSRKVQRESPLLIIVLALAIPTVLAAQIQQSSAAQLPLKHDPKPTVAAITPGDLMTRLYVFADDSMQGRQIGTVGHFKSTEYLARELQRLGIKPGGERGSYFGVDPILWTPNSP